MITATWLNSIWNSVDSLSSVVTKANWGIAGTLLLGCLFTALSIVAGNRKDELLKSAEIEKEQKIADANRVAGEANQRAAEANERTKVMEVKAETARLEQEKIRKQNLELQSEVERERIERLKLQQRFAPRHLTDDQKSRLPNALRAHGAGGKLRVGLYLGLEDGVLFAGELADAISQGGWQIEGAGQFAMGGHLTGVVIVVKNLATIPARAVILQRALADIGITALIGSQEQTQIPIKDSDEVFLFVAPKP